MLCSSTGQETPVAIDYSKQSVWELGVLVHELATGAHDQPFEGVFWIKLRSVHRHSLTTSTILYTWGSYCCFCQCFTIKIENYNETLLQYTERCACHITLTLY